MALVGLVLILAFWFLIKAAGKGDNIRYKEAASERQQSMAKAEAQFVDDSLEKRLLMLLGDIENRPEVYEEIMSAYKTMGVDPPKDYKIYGDGLTRDRCLRILLANRGKIRGWDLHGEIEKMRYDFYTPVGRSLADEQLSHMMYVNNTIHEKRGSQAPFIVYGGGLTRIEYPVCNLKKEVYIGYRGAYYWTCGSEYIHTRQYRPELTMSVTHQ